MTSNNDTKTYIAVGIVAAVASAVTVALILQRRGLFLRPHAATVQEMLDRCHRQVHQIEEQLADLRAAGFTGGGV